MKYFAVFDPKTGEILMRVKTSGSVSPDSVELTREEADADPPVEKTYKVDVLTKKLKRRDVEG